MLRSAYEAPATSGTESYGGCPTATFETDNEVEDVALGVCGLTFPKPLWTHRAHFAAAVWLLRHRPGFLWQYEMPEIIRAYNEATNNPNTDESGYHATITIASMRAAEHFISCRAKDEPTFEVVNALLATHLGGKDWLLEHWRRDTLFSVAARRDWVEPDLVNLPF
jgi:hypothetical protein